MAFRPALVALMLLAPVGAFSKDEVDLRGDTEVMEALLDKVVRRVSQPSAAPFFGATEAARAYRLQGYGVVFVVPPRALPLGTSQGLVPRGAAAELAKDDARGSPTSEEFAKAFALEALLKSLPPAAAPEDAKLTAARERDLEAIEAKVQALSKAAERQRLEAERALDAAMREVQVRLTPRASAGPAEAASPASPAESPEPPVPPAPPWRFWIESSEGADPRSPDRVVEDVKLAITEAIAAAGGGLKSVRPDEYVVVAVDFVPQWDFGDDARAGRTVVVRARKKDLLEHDSGKLPLEELRRRIEVQEY